ncbi:MtN3 and saliva related transmembrane protein [Arcticibacter pallidicorallinus]|uniref:MtN3 and saliva related transmembrane protein n=1 Tax=Arcticibacter pallidicorallinus TaxID=1259464 RepID=A0A2T0UB48_9SPHI|nr:SemiSWEET transporter [Arcticibacter pallidicorallinus]PRY55170.1 MtN3 and saliva related transmembrane protein [Arcticibacter pallidicorallinus]
MNINETLIGIVAGTCTSTAVIPQLVKTIKEKKAEDVSPLMFFILLTGTSIWTYYGFLKDDLPIIVTNIFSSLVTITMLFMKFRFSSK